MCCGVSFVTLRGNVACDYCQSGCTRPNLISPDWVHSSHPKGNRTGGAMDPVLRAEVYGEPVGYSHDADQFGGVTPKFS